MTPDDGLGPVFLVSVQARITPCQRKRIEDKISAEPDKYDNISHWVRVAIIEKLNRR